MNKNPINIKPKILAPAGDFIALRAAIDAGADEVYFGIKGLNMRAGAKNFEEKDLKKISGLCHKNNVKAFLALNTIIYEDEQSKAESLIKKAKIAGVDAIICWDFSIIELCKKHKMKVHVSTQASLSNYSAVKALKKNYPNVERVVLARECTLEHIKKITRQIQKDKLDVEIEVFIHGAMCVSESGRCFMSQELFGKSANRGECLQPCRRNYEVYLKDPEEGHGLILGKDYVMSPKDLCALPIIDKIIDSGVKALKIEGRNRNPEYVHTVVSVYRRIVDEYTMTNNGTVVDKLKKSLMQELEKVYNRGFSTGFYLGKPMNEWTKEYGSSSIQSKSYVGKVMNYYQKAGVAEILIESSSLLENDEILIQGVTTGLIKQNVKDIMLEDKKVMRAEKKQIITMKVDKKVRKNDQLYRIVKKN
jgi:putative protease